MTIALIIAFLVLLCGAANFSALEAALFSARERQNNLLQTLAAEENPARAAFLRNPAAWMKELLMLGAAANLLLTAVGLQLITGPMRAWGWNVWLAVPVIFGLGLLTVQILPQAVALHSPQRTICFTLPIFMVMRTVFSPFTNSLVRAGNFLLYLITPSRLVPHRGLVAEEIETLIEMREEERAISSDQATMLQEIVMLAGLTVRDCMTPRVDLPLMPHDSQDNEARRMIEGARQRFVPVFDEKLDVISGIVDTQAWRIAQCPAWQTIVQQPTHVPETMDLLDALRLHLRREDSAVVIVDEYGGFEGLLSRNNISERLISKAAPLQSAEQAIQPLGQGRYLVSGVARLDEVNRELDVNLEEEGMDTISGLVFTRLGYLPKPGERLEIGNVLIKVKRTTRNRIQQVELVVHEGVEEE